MLVIVLLYNADCFDVLPTLADNSIDAVITDPPYGTTDCVWDNGDFPFEAFWEQVNRVLKDDGVSVVFADQPFTTDIIASNRKHFRYEWLWDKTHSTGGFNARRRPIKHTEDILVFSKNTPRYYWEDYVKPFHREFPANWPRGRHISKREQKPFTQKWTGFPKEVISFPSLRLAKDAEKHPTQKPLELMTYLLGLYTKEGDVVLDPFMGSGTTGVACKNLNREFIGVEKEEDYFVKAGERLAT